MFLGVGCISGDLWMLLFSLLIVLEVIGKIFEKVVVECETYLVKALCVDAFTVEDVVDVAAVAMELSRKPCYGATSLFEALFDYAAYMYHQRVCATVTSPVPKVPPSDLNKKTSTECSHPLQGANYPSLVLSCFSNLADSTDQRTITKF